MSKKTTAFYEILNKSTDTKTVDLLIYGTIPSFEADTYKMKNTADLFVQEFKALERDFDRINIHINSPGGSLYHGFPIFNVIANSKKEIHTYNDGLAASMGAVLLMAGKKVHSAKNALLMIHAASGIAIGNAEAIRETADMLEKYDGIIAQHFADRSGKDLKDIQSKYLNGKDHFLTAQEAIDEGFIDLIEDYESEDAPPSNIMNMAYSEVLNLYTAREEKSPSLFDRVLNYVKDALKPGFESPFDSAQGDTTNTTENQPQNHTMDFQNSLNILAKDQVTAEELAAVRAEISAFTGAAEKFTTEEVNAKIDAAKADITAQLDAAKAEKTSLETQVSDLEATVNSYKASGVNPSNTAGTDTDPIPGEEVENFLSETDVEIKRIKAAQAVK